MEYIAHIDEKDKKRIQTVKNHLEGTAKLSGEFAGKFGKEDWGYCNGMLHDIGKYSVDFLKRITGKVIRGWITLRQERGSAWRKVESTVF